MGCCRPLRFRVRTVPLSELAFNSVHTFTPTPINELTAGFSRIVNIAGIPADTIGAF